MSIIFSNFCNRGCSEKCLKNSEEITSADVLLLETEIKPMGFLEIYENFQSNLRQLTRYLRLTLVFMWNCSLWEGFNFCFSRVFCYCWQSFHFARGTGSWAIILWSLDTFLIFPNFLRSKVLGSSATHETRCIYHVYK